MWTFSTNSNAEDNLSGISTYIATYTDNYNEHLTEEEILRIENYINENWNDLSVISACDRLYLYNNHDLSDKGKIILIMYAAVINQKTKYNDNIVLLDLGDNQLMKLDKANFLFDSIITPYNGKAVYLYNIITSEYQVYPYEGVDDLLDIDDHLQDEGFMYVTVEECKETYNQRIDAIEVQTAATASGLMTIGMITQAWEALFVPFFVFNSSHCRVGT